MVNVEAVECLLQYLRVFVVGLVVNVLEINLCEVQKLCDFIST
jgi:hypothetical protein